VKINVISHRAAVQSAVQAALGRAMETCGGKMETYAKLKCPVKTSNLKNSITHHSSPEMAVVGTDVEYAPYVEFGHRQEPGRYVPAIGKRLVASYVDGIPYMAPAVENHADEYMGVIVGELRKL